MIKLGLILIEQLRAFLVESFSDWRRDRALEEKGAAEAALETEARIDGVADAQHENDMRDRGGADDVARRLRKRIEAERRSAR